MIPRSHPLLLAIALIFLTTLVHSAPTPTPYSIVDTDTSGHISVTPDLFKSDALIELRDVDIDAEVKSKPKTRRRGMFRAVERDIWDGEGLLRRGFWGVREID